MILRFQQGVLDLIKEIGPGELEALEGGYAFFARQEEGVWQYCYSFKSGGEPEWEVVPEGEPWPPSKGKTIN